MRVPDVRFLIVVVMKVFKRQIVGQKIMQREEVLLHSSETCPECRSLNLVRNRDTGETICADCGLVIREHIMDKGPEWRAFTLREKASRSRVGMPATYSVYDKGLSTTISRVNRDAYGRKLPPSTRLQMWRLRKWQIRSRMHRSIDRNLARAMAELHRLSDKASIPSPVKEKAAILYRKALDKGLVRGRSIAAIAAAALYAACRRTVTPRSLREIAETSLVDKGDLSRCYRLLIRELDMKMPVVTPLTYISKIAETVGISGKTQGRAIRILQEAKKKRVAAGKDPMGLAAAALYIASLQNDEKKTQKDVAEAAGVTEVTVRNRYKNLKRQLDLEIE
jgi:transcription initiation factor TFIIB